MGYNDKVGKSARAIGANAGILGGLGASPLIAHEEENH